MLNYVRPGLAPSVGRRGDRGSARVAAAARAAGRAGAAHADGHTGHRHRAQVGWLLLMPVLVVLVVQPGRAWLLCRLQPGSDAGRARGWRVPAAGCSRAGARSRCRWPSSSPGRCATPASRWPGFGCGCSGSSPRPRAGDGSHRLSPLATVFCCAADAEAFQAVIRGGPTPRLVISGWRSREPGGRGPAAVDDRTAPLPVLDADVVHPVGPAHPPYEYSGVVHRLIVACFIRTWVFWNRYGAGCPGEPLL